MRCQRVWTEEKDAVLKRRYLAGDRLADIGADLGVTPEAVNVRLSKLKREGANLPRQRQARNAHPPGTRKRALELVAIGKPKREVSRLLGVPETTIGDWCREFGEEMRQMRAGQKGSESQRAARVAITLPRAPWEGRA